MSIFGRRREDGPEGGAAEPGLPAPAREAELAVPALRAPAAGGAPVGLPPKPSSPPATPVRPGVPAAAAPRANRAEGAAERRTLVVGRGISLQGTVTDAERLVVEGTVESQMIQAAELSVSQSGVFRGEVQVEDAEIAGLFDGTLTARGSLIVRATGKVKGTAKYRRLSVEEGGSITGSMEILPGEG